LENNINDKEVQVRKLISVSVVLALLVTFLVPVAVGACDDCTYTPPQGPPLPEKTTKTMAGAAVWSFLGITDVMGKAVCTVTSLMAGNLGGWSDEIGIIATEAVQGILSGVADLLEGAIGQFLGEDFAAIGTAVADILRSIANAIKVNQV
jgi:2-keto-3-deoxy-L-rhamnonate aldolase RhmA